MSTTIFIVKFFCNLSTAASPLHYTNLVSLTLLVNHTHTTPQHMVFHA